MMNPVSPSGVKHGSLLNNSINVNACIFSLDSQLEYHVYHIVNSITSLITKVFLFTLLEFNFPLR